MAKIIIPMITPFSKGKLDRTTIRKFISYAYENDFDGLFPGGSTGGFASLSLDQHKDLLTEVVNESTGLELFAGICRNNVEETVELGKFAIDLGYHNLVSINPYYHKFSKGSTLNYFQLLLERLDSELFVYNNPSLSGSELTPSMVEELKKEHSNLAGMKDSGDNFETFKEFLSIKDLKVFQGKDAMLKESIEAGAYGGVCSTANFALNTMLIAKDRPEKNEASVKTKELVKTVKNFEVPAIHNYLFRSLILGENSPKNYVNEPFVDLNPTPELDLFRRICFLPQH